jgi:rsbT co-antagonist protein RsbR
MTNEEDFELEILERVADVLLVLKDVGGGNYETRLTMDVPDDHALYPVFVGVNEMIDSLAREQETSSAYRTELEEKLTTIERQRVAIRELTTPIMEVWEGVLCLPVVGVMDSTRSTEMTESLLQSIAQKKAQCVIIDITGIQVMDTATADHFLRMARAVRLLGAECLLTGINPPIAQTIVQMGVDLSDIVTYRNLRTALQHFVVRSTVDGGE